MQRVRIKRLLTEGHAGEHVTVCGWVRSKRESKDFAFIVINDGSSQDNLQVVIDAAAKGYDLLSTAGTGAAVRIDGNLKESPAKGQKWELQATVLEVLGGADQEKYPLQKKGHTLDFLREIAHLRPRTNTFGAVFRIRNVLSYAVHEFFQGRGFVWAHTPIITASDCEGAGELFTVTTIDPNKPPRNDKGEVDWSKDFFGKHAHLTVSGQLEGEFMAMAMGDVYTFGPTFRAENSNTTRHLAEFWMIEPEMAFADLKDDMDLAEDCFRFFCRKVVEHCEPELAFLEKQYKVISVAEIARLAETPFARISYTKAVEELQQSNAKFEFPVKWGIDLQSEHERYLTDQIFKGPAIVTDYPKDIKAFYMRANADGRTVAAMDVLAPRIGEIIGGAQREERLELLEERMRSMKIPMDDIQWFLDLRRYGTAPHAGFGMGFERLVSYLTGMGNIRDTIPCPRAPNLVAF